LSECAATILVATFFSLSERAWWFSTAKYYYAFLGSKLADVFKKKQENKDGRQFQISVSFFKGGIYLF
jgi:hypothetical protein